MAVIYVDVLFLLNAAIDYVLLLAAARMAGEPLWRKRFCAASVLGGGYAVATVLCFHRIDRPVYLLAAAFAMLVIAYGGTGQFWKQSILFVALSCVLGGGMLAICLFERQEVVLEQGVIYTAADLKGLLLSAAFCYMISSTVFSKIGKHSGLTGELVSAWLEWRGRTVSLTVLMDTGNTLTDPVTGRGVMVAEGKRLKPLFPPSIPLEEGFEDPVFLLEQLGKRGQGKDFCLLPYRSVGVDRGLLLALNVDRLVIGNRDLGRTLVALSPTPVSDGGGYHGLMGPLPGK